MLWSYVASGTYDRNVNPADGVWSLKKGPRTHSAHAEGLLVYNGADRDGQNGNPGQEESGDLAVFTPRGLKLRLPTPYAFALIARVYPKVDAFRVLQTTEAVENLGSLATFLSAIVVFSLRLTPVQIGVAVFAAVSAIRL